MVSLDQIPLANNLFKPQEVVDDLNPTEDGEASEEAHCAPYQTQLGLSCYLSMEY